MRFSIPLFHFVRAPLYWESESRLIGLLKTTIVLVTLVLWCLGFLLPTHWRRNILTFIQAPDTLL